MEISQLYKLFLASSGVSIDSRTLSPNNMYFALKGSNFDGNKYAHECIQKGASYAVVDDPSIPNNSNIILVDDVLLTLQNLATYHRNQFSFPVLAITGSNGKTTTKELINAVLSKKYSVNATIGNLNNHIGVPLTILNTHADSNFLIVEMGANHQGEISDLCAIALPDYVFITNVGKAHMDGFGGIEGIRLGKSEMYRYAAKANKTIFIQEDDAVLQSLVPIGANTESITATDNIKVLQKEPTITCQYKDKMIPTHFFGSYNVKNIAVAISIGEYFGVALDQISSAVSAYIPENNRSQIKVIGKNTFILDAYNANPSSMTLSIEDFGKIQQHQKVAILGDMMELGEYANWEHEQIITKANQYDLVLTIFVGPNFFAFKDKYPGNFFSNVEEAKSFFNQQHLEGAYILLKGSRSIALEKLLP